MGEERELDFIVLSIFLFSCAHVVQKQIVFAVDVTFLQKQLCLRCETEELLQFFPTSDRSRGKYQFVISQGVEFDSIRWVSWG